MRLVSIICLVSAAGLSVEAAGCASTYKQCGGKNYTGPTSCCTKGDTCQVEIKDGVPNIWYSQCRPGTAAPTPKGGCSSTYKQCGGKSWTGPTSCCSKGDTCQVEIKDGKPNIWYSQCRPTATSKPTTAKPTSGDAGCSATWKQCGGQKFTGPTKCCSGGDSCQADNIWYSQCRPSKTTAKPTPVKCSNGTSCGFIADGASTEGNDGTICCADSETCYLDPLNIKGLTVCGKAKDRDVCEVTGGFVTGYPCNYAFDTDSSLYSQPSVCCKTATDGCYYNSAKSYMQCTPNICKAGQTKCGYTYTNYWAGSGDSYVISPPTTCCSATQVCGPSAADDKKYVCSDFTCPTGQAACGRGTFEGSPGTPNNICCAKGETCSEDGSAHGTTSFCVK